MELKEIKSPLYYLFQGQNIITGKPTNLRIQEHWLQILALSLMICLISDKLLNFTN